MCPSIGLKSAVIVVGGCGGVIRATAEEGKGTWPDGGVASGSVVNLMPVDTR